MLTRRRELAVNVGHYIYFSSVLKIVDHISLESLDVAVLAYEWDTGWYPLLVTLKVFAKKA